MSDFELISEFVPTGDQPQAIDKLAGNLLAGKRENALLGVTGSGKTFTMAHVIARVNKPTLVLAPNKTLLATSYMCPQTPKHNGLSAKSITVVSNTGNGTYGGSDAFGENSIGLAGLCGGAVDAHINYIPMGLRFSLHQAQGVAAIYAGAGTVILNPDLTDGLPPTCHGK